MKKLFLSLMLLLAAGSSVELSASCDNSPGGLINKGICGAAYDACAVDPFSSRTGQQCYDACCAAH
jgi:hypothetical protein